MFNTKKNLEEMRRKYDHLNEQHKQVLADNERLRGRLEKIECGECFEGYHCLSCKHSYTVETEQEYIGGTYTQRVTTCLLTVPCAKFERTE